MLARRTDKEQLEQPATYWESPMTTHISISTWATEVIGFFNDIND